MPPRKAGAYSYGWSVPVSRILYRAPLFIAIICSLCEQWSQKVMLGGSHLSGTDVAICLMRHSPHMETCRELDLHVAAQPVSM